MNSYTSVGLRVLEVLNFRHMKTNQQNILNGTKKQEKNFKKGDINWRILIAVSKFFKKAASCVVTFGGRSMTYLELIILFGCTRGPWVSVFSSVYLSVSVFADLLLLFSFPALTCSSISVTIWISVHSYDNDNEIVSVLDTSLVATCATGSSLEGAGVLAGTIWTWQTIFLVILFC